MNGFIYAYYHSVFFPKCLSSAMKGFISSRNSLLHQMGKYGHFLGDAHSLMIVITSQCLMLRQCLDFSYQNALYAYRAYVYRAFSIATLPCACLILSDLVRQAGPSWLVLGGEAFYNSDS